MKTFYANAVMREPNIASCWMLNDPMAALAAIDLAGLNPLVATAGVTFGKTGVLVNDPNTATLLSSSVQLQAAAPTLLDFSNSLPMSLELWATPTTVDGTARNLISKIATGPATGYQFLSSTTGLQFKRFDNAGAADTATAPALLAGVSHHLVATYDGTTIRIYVDAILKATQVSIKNIAVNTAAFMVGNQPSLAAGQPGLFQAVSAYGSCLSQRQITTHFNLGRQIFPDPQRIRAYDRLAIRPF